MFWTVLLCESSVCIDVLGDRYVGKVNSFFQTLRTHERRRQIFVLAAMRITCFNVQLFCIFIRGIPTEFQGRILNNRLIRSYFVLWSSYLVKLCSMVTNRFGHYSWCTLIMCISRTISYITSLATFSLWKFIFRRIFSP